MNPKLKAICRRIYHQCYHGGVSIGVGSYVDKRAHVEASVNIDHHSRVFGGSLIGGSTNIGPYCLISRKCRIANSNLRANVRLEPEVEIYESNISRFVTIHSSSYFNHTSIGRYSYIARHSCLNMVDIGAFVSIGPNFMAGTGDHPVDFTSTSPVFYSTLGQCGVTFAERDGFTERKKISIGNDVWIGANVFIRDGIQIGDGVVIGAGAVVTGDVPAYSIVGGVPARLIRMRYTDDTVKQLLDICWWNWDDARLKLYQPLFAQSDIKLFLEKVHREN